MNNFHKKLREIRKAFPHNKLECKLFLGRYRVLIHPIGKTLSQKEMNIAKTLTIPVAKGTGKAFLTTVNGNNLIDYHV